MKTAITYFGIISLTFSALYFILKVRFNNSIHKANSAFLDNTIKKYKLTQMEVELLSVISAFHPYLFSEIAAAYRACRYFDVLLAALDKSARQNVKLDYYIETVILRQEEVEASPVLH